MSSNFRIAKKKYLWQKSVEEVYKDFVLFSGDGHEIFNLILNKTGSKPIFCNIYFEAAEPVSQIF